MAGELLQGVGAGISRAGSTIASGLQAQAQQKAREEQELKRIREAEAKELKSGIDAENKAKAAFNTVMAGLGDDPELRQFLLDDANRTFQETGVFPTYTLSQVKAIRESRAAEAQRQAQSPVSAFGTPAQFGQIGRETSTGFQPLANVGGLEQVASEQGIANLDISSLFAQTDLSGLGTAGGAQDLAPMLQEIIKQAQPSIENAAQLGLLQQALSDPRLAVQSTRAAKDVLAQQTELGAREKGRLSGVSKVAEKEEIGTTPQDEKEAKALNAKERTAYLAEVKAVQGRNRTTNKNFKKDQAKFKKQETQHEAEIKRLELAIENASGSTKKNLEEKLASVQATAPIAPIKGDIEATPTFEAFKTGRASIVGEGELQGPQIGFGQTQEEPTVTQPTQQIGQQVTPQPTTKQTKLLPHEEREFKQWIQEKDSPQKEWFDQFTKDNGQPPDLDGGFYDYRAAFRADVTPELIDDGKFHWPSVDPVTGKDLKLQGHPTLWKQRFVEQVGSNPEDVAAQIFEDWATTPQDKKERVLEELRKEFESGAFTGAKEK